ncbi:MAG TPA: hypothetical protein VJT70_02215 [Sphingomicrobium sp.]|nr:hypothetical protein [Sphingomicrobium sp.]
MSRVDAAAAMDRLPWLPDEPQPQRAGRRRGALGWFAAALALASVAGLGIGVMSTDQAIPPTAPPTATVRLPEARPAAPAAVPMPAQREVNPAPAPEVRSAPAPDVPIAAPPPPKVAAPVAPEIPTVRAVPGTVGRAVQVGAFGSPRQAMNGWRYVVRAYPGLAGLGAVVATSRNSKGRLFYRFQVGTTSQAHSEVLCQRMQKIDFSCGVVGLPKARGER